MEVEERRYHRPFQLIAVVEREGKKKKKTSWIAAAAACCCLKEQEPWLVEGIEWLVSDRIAADCCNCCCYCCCCNWRRRKKWLNWLRSSLSVGKNRPFDCRPMRNPIHLQAELKGITSILFFKSMNYTYRHEPRPSREWLWPKQNSNQAISYVSLHLIQRQKSINEFFLEIN